MKPTIVNIDGVRYVRARAIESEIAALDKALDRFDWTPIPAGVTHAVNESMRRLTEAVANSPDPDPEPVPPDVVVYHNDSFVAFDVTGRGLMLCTTRPTEPRPNVGERFVWRGAMYEVISIDIQHGIGEWAAQVNKIQEGVGQ